MAVALWVLSISMQWKSGTVWRRLGFTSAFVSLT